MVNISEHFSFEVSKIKQVKYCIADNSIAVQLLKISRSRFVYPVTANELSKILASLIKTRRSYSVNYNFAGILFSCC